MLRGNGCCSRRLTTFGLALTAVIVTCAQAQTRPDQIDATESAPLPGRLVSVNDHRMYLDCEGVADSNNGATVIFDSGLGDSALVWARVQPAIARITHACSYDRAGYGESDARLPPRTSAVIVRELHALLAQAGIHPPYVLVGHSFGGWNIQLFASTWPNSVAALVLVDSSQVNQIERYRDVGVNIAPRGVFHLDTTPFVPPNLPPAQAIRAQKLSYDPVTWRTAHNELAGFRASEQQVTNARPLPPVPIVLVSRGRPIAGDNTRRVKRERLWRRLQQEFVDANPGTVHFVARNSGHYIQLQQPQLVIRGICLALHQAKVATNQCELPSPPASQRAGP